MTTTPSGSTRDALGHVWRDGVHFGAGPGEVCHNCGVRKADPRAKSLCAEIQKALKLPRPMNHEYDPFA